MAKFGATYGIKKPDASFVDQVTSPQLLGEHLRYNLVQQTLRIGLASTINGQSLSKNLKDGLQSIGIDSITSFIANKIGFQRYEQLQAGDTVPDYILHKTFHGILGATKGAATAALNGEHGSALTKSALGGTIGGVTAEIIAEEMRFQTQERINSRFELEGTGRSDDELKSLNQRILRDELARIKACTSTAAAVFASVFKCNVSTAQDAACNAIENNFAIHMGRYAYTTYRAYRSGKLAWNAWKLADIADGIIDDLEGHRMASMQALQDYQESQSSMDAAGTPGWQDEGVQIETGRVSVHSTPTHDGSRPKVNSTPVAESSKPRDKGFDTYDSPDSNVFTSDFIPLPGNGEGWIKLKGAQGWKNTKEGTFWKKDKLHKDHWDISDSKGKKVKEVDFSGNQIWPNGPKNKNKTPK